MSTFTNADKMKSQVDAMLLALLGRGRPRKDVGESGATFDFSAFTPPRVPKWTGASRKFVFSKGE